VNRPPGARLQPPALALATLALLWPALTAAQGLEMGVRGGVNVATLANEADGSGAASDPRLGIVAGAFVTWPMVEGLEIQPEVLYSSEGGKVDEPGVDSRVVLDYLDIPVLARFSRHGPGTSRFYVIGGPAFGVRLRARTRTVFSGSTEEIDISDDVERTDVGVVVGGGFERGHLVLDGRYTHGLSNVDARADEGLAVRNRAFAVTVGWKF